MANTFRCDENTQKIVDRLKRTLDKKTENKLLNYVIQTYEERTQIIENQEQQIFYLKNRLEAFEGLLTQKRNLEKSIDQLLDS